MPRGRKKRSAADEFEHIRTQANKKSLGYLLNLVAGLSQMGESSNPSQDDLVVHFHHQKCRILLDAFIRSSADFDHLDSLRSNDLVKMLNNALAVTVEQRELRELKESIGTAAAGLEVRRLVSRLGQVQIASAVEKPLLGAARAVALQYLIPAEYREAIVARDQNCRPVLNLHPSNLLGISARHLLLVFMLIQKLYRERWNRVAKMIPPGKRRVPGAIELAHKWAAREYWAFDLKQIFSGTPEDQEVLCRFMGLFSRDSRGLRAKILGQRYSTGPISRRLIPFDRFPVAKYPDARYIVPNITIFGKSFPYVLDFALMGAYRERGLDREYNRVRGWSLEIYLDRLIADCLPDCIRIPETKYRKGQVASPDLCIIDRVNGWLVVVEAKARRLRAETASSVDDRTLLANYLPTLEAIQRLPGKVSDMLGHQEFSEWREDLLRISDERIVLVGVVSDAVFSQDDLERHRAAMDSEHPLVAIQHRTASSICVPLRKPWRGHARIMLHWVKSWKTASHGQEQATRSTREPVLSTGWSFQLPKRDSRYDCYKDSAHRGRLTPQVRPLGI